MTHREIIGNLDIVCVAQPERRHCVTVYDDGTVGAAAICDECRKDAEQMAKVGASIVDAMSG